MFPGKHPLIPHFPMTPDAWPLATRTSLAGREIPGADFVGEVQLKQCVTGRCWIGVHGGEKGLPKSPSGWWFQTLFIFHNIWDVILPIDFHIFQRDWNQQALCWGCFEARVFLSELLPEGDAEKNLQGNCNKAIGLHNYHNRTIYSTSRGNSPDGSQDLVVDAFLVRCLFPLS